MPPLRRIAVAAVGTVLTSCLLALPSSALAGEGLALVGGPFEIREAFTDFDPHFLAVTRARDAGSFVAVWDESAGNAWMVRARRYDAAGHVLDPAPIEVNPTIRYWLQAPARVGADAAGGFVVVWAGSAQASDSPSIWGRRFTPAGAPDSAEARLNGATSGSLDEPALAMAAAGSSVAAWSEPGAAVWFQRYDSAGSSLLAGDQSLPAEGVGAYDSFAPAVAIDPDTEVFVVVRRTRQGPSPSDPACTNFRFGVELVGQLYSPAGETIGAPFYPLPGQPGGYRQPLVSLAPVGNGEFVAAWAQGNCSGTAPVVPTARVVHADGTLSDPFPLTTEIGSSPSVASDGQGRFAVGWWTAAGDVVRRFDRSGIPLGDAVLAVPASAEASIGSPLLASDGAGRIVVAWQTARDVATQYGTATEHRFLGQLLAPDAVRRVAIDIRPGTTPNPINLGSNGAVPVAILSDAGFDATTVDPTTVSLASAQVRLRGNGTPMASVSDVDGDGLDDLVVQVSTNALTLTASDTTATLQGTTRDGLHIEGVDSVRIVK
jgi:hypothetical protein